MLPSLNASANPTGFAQYVYGRDLIPIHVQVLSSQELHHQRKENKCTPHFSQIRQFVLQLLD